MDLLRKAPWARKSLKNAQNKSTSLLKQSINRFKRLSACSWDEFDTSVDIYDSLHMHKQKLEDDKFKLNLYPSEGQPCSCVCTWQVTLSKKVTGKVRKCKIEHYVHKDFPIRVFTGRITIFDDKIAIWGTIKDAAEVGEDFELTLSVPTYASPLYVLEGSLMRGNRKRSEKLELQTHDVVVMR